VAPRPLPGHTSRPSVRPSVLVMPVTSPGGRQSLGRRATRARDPTHAAAAVAHATARPPSSLTADLSTRDPTRTIPHAIPHTRSHTHDPTRTIPHARSHTHDPTRPYEKTSKPAIV
jgi:hypothetical protein